MKKWLAIIGLLLLLFLGMGISLALSLGPSSLIQPIAFSHKSHAGDFKIACEYCHSYARRSPVAGVPSVQQCMGCHKITALDNPEVKKLQGYWKRKEPIPWIKIYDLPDSVIFTHKRHVLEEIECRTCHGPVETMDQVRQVMSLGMGWCVSCHKEQRATLDCLDCHK